MEEPMVETEVADSDPPRGSTAWKLIAIITVLTIVGIWLVPGTPPDEPMLAGDAAPRSLLPAGQDTDTPPSLLGQDAPDIVAALESLPATASRGALIDNRPGARARALIARMRTQGEMDLDQIFAAAEQAEAGRESSDAYLLYFFAAREGHAKAALTLGEQADPATHDPTNGVLDAPDLNQAHKWYDLAAQSGDSEARTRLANLRGRVDRLAAAGDPQAQRISLLWD